MLGSLRLNKWNDDNPSYPQLPSLKLTWPPKFMVVGRLLSYWVPVYFQGRSVKLQGGYPQVIPKLFQVVSVPNMMIDISGVIILHVESPSQGQKLRVGGWSVRCAPQALLKFLTWNLPHSWRIIQADVSG